MNPPSYRPLLAIALASLCLNTGVADTIDIGKPVSASLTPDLLYFDFDQESEGTLPSQGELSLSASIEPGKVDAYPSWVPGRSEAFGKAMEFNYGALPPFTEPNNLMAGNHLSIANRPELQMAGQSFTVGAWVKIPEEGDLDLSWVRHKMLIGSGAFSEAYPGWGLQISCDRNVWTLTLLMVGGDSHRSRCDAVIPQGVSPGSWRHVAASVDAATRKVSLWVDGERIVSREIDGDIGESKFPLVIGERGMSTYCNLPLTLDDVFIVSGVHDFKFTEQ